MNERQFADRIGNIDDQLVEEARYPRRRGGSWSRRLLATAAMLALMAASFTVGALAFSREVPVEQETIELPGIGLTLILPNSWKGDYMVNMSEDDSECEIYIKSIYEQEGEWKGTGYLFRIGKAYDRPMTPEELNEISPVPCRYLFSTSNATYSLNYASDVQWNVNDSKQEQLYHRMREEVSQIRFLVDGVLSD